MIRSLLSALAAFAVLGAALPSVAQQAEGPFEYAENDAAMNAAIAEARRTLPVFWDRAPEADTSRELLKVRVRADDGANEYLWLDGIEPFAGGYRGVLLNQPRLIEGLRRGSTVTFAQNQIVDWVYEADGRLWGGWTERVMIENLPPDEAAARRAMMSETPLEPKID